VIEIVNTGHASVTENGGMQPSAPSASSAVIPKSNAANGFALADQRTVANNADGSGGGLAPTVRATTLKPNGEGAADGADASITPDSGKPASDGAAGGSDRERAEAICATPATLPR
jgi:hypothetical protein